MSDPNSKFDKSFTIDVEKIEPQVSWGTNPAMVSDVTGKVPTPEDFGQNNEIQIESAKKALSYMDLNLILLSWKFQLTEFSLVHVQTHV